MAQIATARPMPINTLGAAAVQRPSPDFRAQLAQHLAAAAASPTNDLSGFYSTLHTALQARQQQQAPPVATAPPAAAAPALTSRIPAAAAHAPSLQAAATAPPVPGAGVGAKIAKSALTQLGTPYQFGGKAALGSRTDCSGLLQASAAANGVSLPRTTYEQYKVGTPVPLNQLQPGDAVFFEPGPQGPGHVTIYIGNGRVVEDPHTGASVEISALHGRGAIVGARRY